MFAETARETVIGKLQRLACDENCTHRGKGSVFSFVSRNSFLVPILAAGMEFLRPFAILICNSFKKLPEFRRRKMSTKIKTPSLPL